ncbi:MAG TPA: tetratricopeptide repeat protein [Vicinamibacteria bacterium]
MRALRRALAAAAASLAVSAGADTITLTNGRVIETDRAWFEGNEVRYEKAGGVYGLPRTLVARLDRRAAGDGAPDADVVAARERLAAGDAVEAVRLLRRALARDPRSLAALQGLSEASLALGDARAARQAAEGALAVAPDDARALAALGSALSALGDGPGAARAFQRSLELRPDPEVARRMAEVAPAPSQPGGGARFRLRYEGSVNEPLGDEVLRALDGAFAEFARRLGFQPDESVSVVLKTEAAFQDEAPEWAGALNDGAIHVPVAGVRALTPRLAALLRHELAHSFILARTRGNCPTWLQEGVSQLLEGGDPARGDEPSRAALRAGRLKPLITLEAPFQGLEAGDLPLAYAESLSAVAYIVKRRGEPAVVRLLNSLGDGFPPEEALPVALALSYPEFQRSWEAHLAAAR